MDIIALRLSAMRALWGIITSNVRKVVIYEKNNMITLYFYYDHLPSEKEIDLSEDAATEVIADFPEPYQIACERIVSPFPQKITYPGYLIYSRFEEGF